MKKLNELFDIDNDMKIYSIHSDSRYVLPYSVFFCIEGLSVDGHRYVDDAIFQGAKVIVHTKDLIYQDGIVYIKVKDTLDELNRVSNIFYDYPSRKMKVIGVTGTSGKTVVSSMIKNIMNHYCLCAYMGTISLEYAGIKEQCPYTTPETLYVQQKMYDMAKRGVKVVAMEASSHGLALRRINAIDFNIAVMTNISEAHLDFHGTMKQYIESKKKLFSQLSSTSIAVLNRDDPTYEEFKDATRARVITYGIKNESEIMAKNIRLSIDKSSFDLCLKGNEYPIVCPIVGEFNVYNVLATVGALVGMGLDDRMIVEQISHLQQIEGRMELVENKQKLTVIVDYCQYSRNYENIFKFVSSVAKGKIIGVIGVPSKRYHGRRAHIGQLANRYLDYAILTELDDKGESLEVICQDVQKELKDIPSIVISQRFVAIEQAIVQARKDDIILLLGKGHEKYISLEVGQREYPGDKEVAIQTMKSLFE